MYFIPFLLIFKPGLKLVNNTFRCEKIDPGVCRDMHASDLQILTRLTLGQVMRTYVRMCDHDKKLHTWIHSRPEHVDINAV